MKTTPTYDCRICGWEGMASYHKGTVDCINAYRAYVEDLRSQLPRGKQVMVCTLERETSAQVWIQGDITFKGLDRLITLIRFMQEAWANDVAAEAQHVDEAASQASKTDQIQ